MGFYKGLRQGQQGLLGLVYAVTNILIWFLYVQRGKGLREGHQEVQEGVRCHEEETGQGQVQL